VYKEKLNINTPRRQQKRKKDHPREGWGVKGVDNGGSSIMLLNGDFKKNRIKAKAW